MNNLNIKPMKAKSALNRLTKNLPYKWDLNIYRGCMHGCKYCYAIHSHEYLTSDSFFNTLYYKENIGEVLEKELSRKSWKNETINLGGVTDSYQPIERKIKLMPEILKLCIKYRNPINIATKSSLILRDIELIEELSKVAYVNIAVSITTVDEEIRRKIEPHSSPTTERFKVLKELKKININKGVLMMPIIPILTDNLWNAEEIFRLSYQSEANYIVPGYLYLRNKTRNYFLNFLKSNFTFIYDDFVKLYLKGSVNKSRKTEFYDGYKELSKKYPLKSNYIPLPKISKKPEQLSLFQE